MASYFNLTLDTTAPAGLTLSINDGAIFTSSPTVTLSIAVTDADTTGYQMKVWGIDSAADEATSIWETFATTKQVVLPAGDGLKTVSVKVRDAVGNESTTATDDITLNTSVPTITVTGPDVDTVSLVEGFNSAVVSFTVDVAFTQYKVCVVPATNSLQDAGTVIPTTNGSVNTSGSKTEGEDPFPANTPISVTIKGADLETASSGDGVKIIKIFAQNEAGSWSEA